jgi:amino-acid N-acetyltransferase
VTAVSIGAAQPNERDAVLALLAEHRLPVDGISDCWPTTLVACAEGRVVGSAALELYEGGALLRSVAVAGERRGQGIGHDLIRAAIRLARANRAPAVFLLTTTADGYFPKFGFERIRREDVPESVTASVEFTSACPSTATVMRMDL